MRSHGTKIILMGRILEILSKHACGKARRPMTTQEIWDELEKEKFNGQARAWIRRGMICKHQVAWLLRRMLEPSVLPPSFGPHFALPLVNKIIIEDGEAGGTKWMLAATVVRGSQRPQEAKPSKTPLPRKKALKAAKSVKPPHRASKKAPESAHTPPAVGGVEKRGIEDAIAETWRLIDLVKERLSADVSESEKVKWASVLSQAIGTLNKLYYKAGVGQVDEDDLAQILSRVPEKYQKFIKKRLAGGKNGQPPLPERARFEGIHRGDLVEVVWLDASLSRGIVKVTNRVVATYKRTVGRFVGIFKDDQYKHPHVLVQHEADENGVADVSSIPLGIVVGVNRLGAKSSSKRIKGTDAQWTQPLGPAGGVKIMTRRRKQ